MATQMCPGEINTLLLLGWYWLSHIYLLSFVVFLFFYLVTPSEAQNTKQ